MTKDIAPAPERRADIDFNALQPFEQALVRAVLQDLIKAIETPERVQVYIRRHHPQHLT